MYYMTWGTWYKTTAKYQVKYIYINKGTFEFLRVDQF